MTSAENIYTPYSTIAPMLDPTAVPSWVTGQDQQRIMSYSLYEQIYWNVPEAFSVSWRGTQDRSVIVPSGRTIVEACNRYLARGFDYTILGDYGSTNDQAALKMIMDSVFKREKIRSKFNTQKRYGLIRGDSVWHVVADMEKSLGSRISIYEVDPAAYFPIPDETNPDRIVGVHLVDQVVVGSDTIIKRQTYRKVTNPGGGATITSELGYFKIGSWDDREGQKVETVTSIGNASSAGIDQPHPAVVLPPEITSLPVYHVKNFREPGTDFGSSELRGLEVLIRSMSQTVSDEELSLALDGLGVWVTDAPDPIDDDSGESIPWQVYPGVVLGLKAGEKFERARGVDSVTPMQDHLTSLNKMTMQASGTPDIAVGMVDVSAVQSGVALSLQMGPMLSKNDEKQEEIKDEISHMLFDLSRMWIPAYEEINTADYTTNPTAAALADVTFGPMLPVDREAVLNEVVSLRTPPSDGVAPLVSAEWARQYLADKLGYEFGSDMETQVRNELTAISGITNDAFGARLDSETGA